MLLILLLALCGHPAFAKSQMPGNGKRALPQRQSTPAKRQILEQLHTTCLKSSFTEGKSQGDACDCLRDNYEKKFSLAQLELLARIQSGSANKEEIAGQDELFEFDMLASQNCLENKAWRWKPEKEEKDGTAPLESKSKSKSN